MDILEVLVLKGTIDKKQAKQIRADSSSTGFTIEESLIKSGITPQEILLAKGEYFDIPIKELEGVNIEKKVLDYIPQDAAIKYHFLPLNFEDGVLDVGMVNPDDIEARDALNFISSKLGIPFKLYVISEGDFNEASTFYKGLTGEVSKSLSDLDLNADLKLVMDAKEDKKNDEDVDTEGGGELKEDAPVKKIVDTILRYATDGNASDVHIEPWRENVKVRFRVDGVMNTSLTLPSRVHSAVVARIKILSNMRLDEKRKPQDGRFTARIENRKIDFRVSTFPTYFGEKVVMRILDQERGIKKLDELGMSPRNLEMVRKAIKKPYGLILISGPTGSGKTTTLYSMLNEVDKEHQNVLSLEDPIEYNIEGMSQSQVQADIGYTFASGLRTTLRQDPDVIMVGEIRDKETAQLAIQAALTGHLVLSTIHTNNAVGVVPRLIDMGIDPYLIAPTLIMTMAQRLTLGLCPGAGVATPVDGALKLMIDKQFSDLPQQYIDQIEFTDKVYKTGSTSDCPNGTRGRVAVIEVLEMDKEMEAIILKNPTDLEIQKIARSKGMLTMKEDAIIKSMHQIVPFEEVNML